MSKQLLIYEKVVPVSSKRHVDWSVKTGEDYSFAKHINSVPLTAVEFPSAAGEYAIVFTGTDEALVPAAIMGVRDQENLYMKEDGSWHGRYVPAFVRRYPFVFSSTDQGKTFTLCIDEDFAGCNQEGRGERIFDADGNRTQYLESVLAFVQQYQAQFQRTGEFCKKLKELDLLEPMHARMKLTSGQQLDLTGFMAVNRKKLKELPAEKLEELVKSDELELIYLHLQSIRNFTSMAERVKQTSDAAEGVAEKSEAAAPSTEVASSNSKTNAKVDERDAAVAE